MDPEYSSTNTPNYIREANVCPVKNQLCTPNIFQGLTNTPNYVGEANVRPVKNELKVKGIEIPLTAVLKFKLSGHRLRVQQRRSLGILRDERIRTICDTCEIGEEFHYLLNCSNEHVKGNRTKSAVKYDTHHPNVPKFCSLVNMTPRV